MKRIFWGTYFFLIFTLLFVQFILGPAINMVAKIHLQDSITVYNRKLAMGAFHMMAIDLLRLPDDEWKNRISQLESQFGYKITLLAIPELSLPKAQIDQLLDGKIAVINDGELLYQRIGESQMVLRKGPFSVLEPDPGYFNFVSWLAVSAIIGLLTYISIVPYWRQLRKMSDAAVAFGNGEFTTRVDMSMDYRPM